MSQKVSLKSSAAVGIIGPEWNPDSKEPWHLEFDKEPVNDKKWSCIVTAAVPTEVQDQEYIQIYNQCVSLGFRKSVKIITMSDIIALLRAVGGESKNNKKDAKNNKDKKKPEQDIPKKSEIVLAPPVSPFGQIIELATKYAVVTDSECKLPPDLMASVIKYLILLLKDENRNQKRTEAVRERKIRERNIKAKFIRDLKPYEMSEEEPEGDSNFSYNILNLKEPINDEPIDGPDLYVMLTDFYDLNVFPEFEKIQVPFLAILEISTVGSSGMAKESSFSQKSDGFGRKKSQIISFWENYKLRCSSAEKVDSFKNIATLKYEINPVESNFNLPRVIFDELTWMMYSVYCIYRQHQKYLQELQVQRLIMSLQPLELSRCVVYNKLCDAMITGEPLTPLLVLYAIIEQVVAGVPETSSMPLEYQRKSTDFFSDGSEDVESVKKSKKHAVTLVTPCWQCRGKKYENICEKLKENVSKSSETSEHGEWYIIPEEYNASTPPSQNLKTPSVEENTSFSAEYIIPETLLDQALSEKQTEKDFQSKKKWKTPSLCFYGDSIFFQTYHCEPRLFDPEILVDRFMKNTDLPRVWTKYPKPTPADRAFFNFHFCFLKKISNKSEELLKIYIYFMMAMRLIGITKSLMYKGDEEELSVVGTKDRLKKFSRVKFSKDDFNLIQIKNDFSNFFYKTFIRKTTSKKKDTGKKPKKKISERNIVEQSESKTDEHSLRKAKSQFLVSPTHQESEPFFSAYLQQMENDKSSSGTTQKQNDSELILLYALLDCLEITSLTQPHLINDKENFMKLVQDYKFYEKFEPHVMIQRLFESQDDFNTIQSSYFPPTDTIIIIMYNDYDHRGMFFTKTTQALPTPVYFKDFYSHVYQEISNWLTEEVEERKKFVTDLKEKAKAETEKKDAEYLSQLKKYYCGLSEEEKKVFLDTELESLEIEVKESDLEDLPVKPKPPYPDKLSFIATNYMDLRVEFTRNTHEFLSPDGTEVNVKIENWMYTPSSLLRLRIRRSNLQLYYNQWLEQDIETSFTFKTKSDIIFSFYKNESEREDLEEEEEEEEEDEDDFNYQVTVSWPSGLIIQPITLDSTTYIKQSYLKIYKKGWDIEDEASRCFVKNGQVIIFKEYGGYDILCPSGTKYTFFESGAKYEITTAIGEVWEVPTKGRCKNRKNFLTAVKVFIGVDTKAQEIFYKREDGVYCMLWPNGKLVTTFPDGTKITTMPDFDENEIGVEWTEEEKQLLRETLTKPSELSVGKPRSHSFVKNSTSNNSSTDNSDEKFVSISCSYLIEHPKYSSVFFNCEEGNIRLTMPEDVGMFIYPGGNYVLQRESNFLKVCYSTIDFLTECPECRNRSTVTLSLDDSEILCKCVDFFDKVFLLYRNGNTVFQENDESGGEKSESKPEQKTTSKHCVKSHNKSMALTQRCFAFERDLSGVEFLHADSIAFYSDKLSDNTFFEINTDDPSNFCHTFTNPHYKVGYENWVMDYEDKDDSLPTNLKKKDLKEMGVKEVTKNLFKYPFPPGYSCGDRQQSEKSKEDIEMPKLIMARTIRCWPGDSHWVIDEMHKNIMAYQKTMYTIWKEYKNHKVADYWSHDSRYVMMRLRKIALTLNQSLQMYPHLCTQFPSTEKEIHYFGHFINSMAEIKSHFQDINSIPDCKQIPIPLPRNSDFPSIYEESESPKSIQN